MRAEHLVGPAFGRAPSWTRGAKSVNRLDMQAGFPHTVMQVTPALHVGGVERTTIEIAAALSAAGGRCIVVSRGGRLERELARTGAELIRLPVDSKNPLIMLANARRLRNLAKFRQVRILHARSRAPAWSALAAARSLGLPLVTTYHGVYSAQTPWKRFYNSIMARGDVVIANSNFTKAHILQTYPVDPAKVPVIPRGVDLVRFDPLAVDRGRIEALRAAWHVPADCTRALVVLPARLTRWKGHGVLIEAAARLEARSPGRLRLILVGEIDDSAYHAELQRLALAQGLGGLVSLVGHVEDMPAALALAEIAVFPSTRAEAFGRGAIEAQAMQIPVIASDLGGMAETVLHGETGLLVGPGDVAKWSQALEQILDMPRAQRSAMGAAGRARVLANYGEERLKSATLDVYRGLISKAPI
jgi:glycosyltransferase involved in cell wall biosynthesis